MSKKTLNDAELSDSGVIMDADLTTFDMPLPKGANISMAIKTGYCDGEWYGGYLFVISGASGGERHIPHVDVDNGYDTQSEAIDAMLEAGSTWLSAQIDERKKGKIVDRCNMALKAVTEYRFENSPTKRAAMVPEVLAPETQVIPAVIGHTPETVTAQYKRAIAGALEMLRFGAMLIEVDMSLTRETHKGGCFQTGETIKAWLETNCPDINYKTAMRFKSLADGMRDYCQVPARLPLTLALPTADGATHVDDLPDNVNKERIVKIQQKIWEMVEGTSARQLQFRFETESKPKGGARPAKEVTVENIKADLHRREWIHQVNTLYDMMRDKTYIYLEQGQMKQLDELLMDVRTALKEVMSK